MDFINRGAARNIIFKDKEDNLKFLEILQNASEDYNFVIYSFCLMSNHYHLLMKIKNKNISQIMQKVNSRYSIYFNNKYKRVGPLWQGRFKSWFIYDEQYLKALIKYIEFNPIKAKITYKIGIYKWAMSSSDFEFLMLNFELINNIDFTEQLSKNEDANLDELLKTKIESKNNEIIKKKVKQIQEYFDIYNKEFAIYSAVADGYTQSKIAKYLNLSSAAISKILKI